ncbi:MAG: 30S ribosomal protein S8 [Candidatus Dadabacteria bacterium]|nr:MAG: 30S ribosomal protein S8 [Candidatus Dadabacteria bacterium]
MGMTDPIADMLTRIRNAVQARHERTSMPWSRLREEIARVMLAEGYLNDIVVDGEGARKRLAVVLRYSSTGEPVISGLRRVSKPSLRVYSSAKDLRPVRGGLGIAIVSTPAGVLVDREARRRNVGGEILCEVW